MLPMRRWVAWAGIALLAAYLVFIGGGWLGIYRYRTPSCPRTKPLGSPYELEPRADEPSW
jgi:hypothetical protein